MDFGACKHKLVVKVATKAKSEVEVCRRCFNILS